MFMTTSVYDSSVDNFTEELNVFWTVCVYDSSIYNFREKLNVIADL